MRDEERGRDRYVQQRPGNERGCAGAGFESLTDRVQTPRARGLNPANGRVDGRARSANERGDRWLTETGRICTGRVTKLGSVCTGSMLISQLVRDVQVKERPGSEQG